MFDTTLFRKLARKLNRVETASKVRQSSHAWNVGLTNQSKRPFSRQQSDLWCNTQGCVVCGLWNKCCIQAHFPCSMALVSFQLGCFKWSALDWTALLPLASSTFWKRLSLSLQESFFQFGSQPTKVLRTIFVGSRVDILFTQMHYICFIRVSGGVRWVIDTVGCCNG